MTVIYCFLSHDVVSVGDIKSCNKSHAIKLIKIKKIYLHNVMTSIKMLRKRWPNCDVLTPIRKFIYFPLCAGSIPINAFIYFSSFYYMTFSHVSFKHDWKKSFNI